jgi:hypothetical protein
MSHLTTIKTELRDQNILLETFEKLNITYTEGGYVRAMGSLKPVDFGIIGKGGLLLGFRKNTSSGSYEISGMWESLEKKEIKNLIDKIYQEYALRKVIKETQKNGFSLIFQQRTETGNIRLILRKLAVNA